MGLSIYIASSWRNRHAVEMLTELLEQRGHTVASFVRAAGGNEGAALFGPLAMGEWLTSEDARRKFLHDTHGATTSDLVIYLGPSGTDAWAEVGAAFGADVPIVGLWAKGEPAGIMRLMMRAWYDNFHELLEALDQARCRGEGR